MFRRNLHRWQKKLYCHRQYPQYQISPHTCVYWFRIQYINTFNVQYQKSTWRVETSPFYWTGVLGNPSLLILIRPLTAIEVQYLLGWTTCSLQLWSHNQTPAKLIFFTIVLFHVKYFHISCRIQGSRRFFSRPKCQNCFLKRPLPPSWHAKS